MPDKHARISEKAYKIWEKEGRPSGRHEHHWDEAAREIEGEDAAVVKKLRAKKPAAAPVEAAAPAASAKPKEKAPPKPKAPAKPKSPAKPKAAAKAKA